MSDPIQAAVAAALAAQNAAPATAGVPATQSTPGTAVGAPGATPARGSAVSLQDMVTGSTAVDMYAKVDKRGIQLGDNSKFLCDELLVKINLSEVVAFYGVRFGQGSSTTYKRSLDRMTEQVSGRAWSSIIAEAQQIDPKCKGDYSGADIPMTLLEEVDGGKNAEPIEAGKVVGYTTSITGYKPFQTFASAMYKAGLGDIDLKVKITHKEESRNGNEWGILLFELVGTADNDENVDADSAAA